MADAVIDIQAPPNAAVHFSGSAAEPESSLLAIARERAQRDGLPFAGGVTPEEAWNLVTQGEAVLVDVRTAEERKFVGHVPDSLHVAWMTGLSLSRNPRFVKELEAKTGKDEIVLLLCRSGKRSAAAAEAATKAGFRNVFNVLEGFEGDLDDSQRRGAFNGWRFASLPWIQD
jgi:rhodanese-related sulfurtransferase